LDYLGRNWPFQGTPSPRRAPAPAFLGNNFRQRTPKIPQKSLKLMNNKILKLNKFSNISKKATEKWNLRPKAASPAPGLASFRKSQRVGTKKSKKLAKK
jgi:hypothetical protein